VHPLLRIEHLSKTFPGQVALDDVSITLEPGRTHALVGQNGSGKSTLIKILAGYHQPDEGYTASYWRADGTEQPLVLGSAADAEAAGVRFVHQDLGLVEMLSSVENLALGVGFTTKAGRINWKVDTARARQALSEIGFDDFDVKMPVGLLTASQKTGVALARAMQNWENGATLLVLDEPTASLPGADVQRLFDAIHRLKARGVAILYVSHHLDEVFAIADDVTILRDGHLIATQPVADLNHDRLIELMIGHTMQKVVASSARTGDRVLISLAGVSGGNVANIDLDIHEGEVVGVAGINGSGREHLIPLATGQIPTATGEVTLNGVITPPYSPGKVLAAKSAFLSADRAVQGVVQTLTVLENTTLGNLTKHTKFGRILKKNERVEVKTWIERLRVRTAGAEVPITTLSGGNQQKVLFARGLRLEPTALMLDEPTRGIDVGAKEEIHSIIDNAAANGAAVLLASTDTDELVRLSSRVIILRNGVIAAELTGADITSENIEHAQLQSKPATDHSSHKESA